MTLAAEMLALARLSLKDPRAGLRHVLALGIPLPARTAGLLLLAVTSTLVMHASFLLFPPTDDPTALFLAASPLRSAALQWITLALSVGLVWRVGRAFGGQGSLPDALLTVVWLQILMLGVQVAQLVALVLVPPLGALLGLIGLVLFFWLLASFVAELHGFASRGAVLVGIFLTGFALALVLVMLLILIFGPEAVARV